MDTKWKDYKNKVIYFLKDGGYKIVIGICLTFISLIFFCKFINNIYFYGYYAEYMILYSIAPNIIAAFPLYQYFKDKKYRQWFPVDQEFYNSWKKQNIYQYKVIFLFVLFKFIFFSIIATVLLEGMDMEALFYLALIDIFSECVVYGLLILRFMHSKLNELIACMAGIQQHNLDAAIQSEKMKVDLISNVSHDLKTPLTSMIGYIELIKKEELTPVMQDYTMALSAKAEKLKEMIESLFSLAKTSSGNIELTLEKINFNRLIEQIYADMEEQIRASELEFISELTVQDTGILTDSSYIYRICQNLMENTLKYSAKYTRVYLKTSVIELPEVQIVRFELTNTANYRMDFTKDQIVERFTRGDEARTSEGNGLGLAIVSAYTVALGGRFDILIDCDQFKAVLDFIKESE